jgi:hypothetical protein
VPIAAGFQPSFSMAYGIPIRRTKLQTVGCAGAANDVASGRLLKNVVGILSFCAANEIE